jgi:antitoxin (DNA-binding transcriptional repressor) of toxin-antitoxin stability system
MQLLGYREAIDAGIGRNYACGMTVTLEYAAKHFAELLDAIDAGDSVEVTRPDKPTLRLSGEVQPAVDAAPGKRILGAGVGELRVPDDEEWEWMDKEWRKSFEDKFGPEAA